MKKVEATRSIIRLSYVLAIVAAATIAVLAGMYERQSRLVARQEARVAVGQSLSLLRSELQGRIEADVELVQALVGVVEYDPNLSQAHFDRLGERITRGREEIIGVSLAPGMVVSQVYPPEHRPSVLGLDYMAAPEQRHGAMMARALGTTLLSGPLELLQGGTGFVARTPAYVDGEHGRSFWGLVSLVIDRDALYRVTGVTDPALPIEVAIGGPDGLVDGAVFHGDPAILGLDPVVTRAELPYGAWRLSAIPRGGWSEPAGIWTQRLLFALGALLIVAPILGAARLLASRQDSLGEIRAREAELSQLSWRLEFALAASNVGVWDVDLATDRLLWDERTKALFGATGRDGFFSEVDWAGALHPEDRDRALAEAQAAAEGRGKFVSSYRIVRPDGEVRHVRDIAALYVGEDGTRRLVGLVWDVTEDVARQEELNRRRLEAEAETAAKSRFLAAMSHEIRTPMSGVLGLLGLMLEAPLSRRQRERATIALASARSLLEILNDILDFSKLEANQIRISTASVAVRPLAAEVIDLMRPDAAARGLDLSCAVDDAVPEWVATDGMRLRQVLTNLVSNATKFTVAGQVVVRIDYAAARGGELRVEVEDTGIGIAEAQHARIFQQFVQADTSLTRRAGGTGLGLAISKQLVELMGGAIGLRSVPGMGSTFCFRLPAPPADPPALAASDAPSFAGASPPLRVLLAEDNSTNRYLVNAYLREAGHRVESVGNGTEAVAAAARGGFDVVLMDMQMPEIDGLAATRAIRDLPGRAGVVPIIALTANAMPSDRDACFAAGMTDYLAKPVDLAALHAALGRARGAAAPPAALEPEAPPRRSAAG
jgi:signal transduction histidine kinase/CheY-like chemotaxis protein